MIITISLFSCQKKKNVTIILSHRSVQLHTDARCPCSRPLMLKANAAHLKGHRAVVRVARGQQTPQCGLLLDESRVATLQSVIN